LFTKREVFDDVSLGHFFQDSFLIVCVVSIVKVFAHAFIFLLLFPVLFIL